VFPSENVCGQTDTNGDTEWCDCAEAACCESQCTQGYESKDVGADKNGDAPLILRTSRFA
jgi:hypothetical protein